MSQENQQGSGNKLALPDVKTLTQAAKLSIKVSKPICFYFYVDSLKKKISICSDGEDKIIFKNQEEHTSPILNTYKCGDEYLVITENTIYVVSSNISVN